jgi:hypothetical protein
MRPIFVVLSTCIALITVAGGPTDAEIGAPAPPLAST